MYVRWQRRTRKQLSWHHNHASPVLLTASLVESRPIDGKPRQHTVAYLGSIRERFLGEPGERRWFWRKVAPRLDALALSPDEREMIEASVARMVTRPTAEEEAESGARLRELEARASVRR